MKKKVSLIVLVVMAVALCATILCSCEVLQKIPVIGDLIGGGGNSNVTKPKITSVQTLKDEDGWTESKEYLFNKDCTNPMPVTDNENYFIVLNYDNPSKLSISSVKINGAKIDSTAFYQNPHSVRSGRKRKQRSENVRYQQRYVR